MCASVALSPKCARPLLKNCIRLMAVAEVARDAAPMKTVSAAATTVAAAVATDYPDPHNIHITVEADKRDRYNVSVLLALTAFTTFR